MKVVLRILGVFVCFMALSLSVQGKSDSFDLIFDFNLTEVETYLNCKEAQFTEGQENQIKELYEGATEFKDELIIKYFADLFKIGRSFAAHMGMLSDPNSTREEAQQSAKTLIPLFAEFMQNLIKDIGEKESELTNEIIYQVATPEQRAPIVVCIDEKDEEE